MNEVMYRKCSFCKQEKELSLFPKDSSRKQGYGYRCFECCHKYNEKNKEKISFLKKQYYFENKNNIIEYKKIYKEKNLENYKTKEKEYYEKNKNYILLRNKEYYSKNKEYFSNSNKEYRIKNKKNVLEKKRTHYYENIQKIRSEQKEYAKKNRTKLNVYQKNKYYNDPSFRIAQTIRRRCVVAIKNGNAKKNNKTEELLGCTFEQAKKHIESLFLDGMNWNNYGKWHIDHIKPCALFDLTIESNQFMCFNYKNLQPLWAIDNLRKGAKYEE